MNNYFKENIGRRDFLKTTGKILRLGGILALSSSLPSCATMFYNNKRDEIIKEILDEEFKAIIRFKNYPLAILETPYCVITPYYPGKEKETYEIIRKKSTLEDAVKFVSGGDTEKEGRFNIEEARIGLFNQTKIPGVYVITNEDPTKNTNLKYKFFMGVTEKDENIILFEVWEETMGINFSGNSPSVGSSYSAPPSGASSVSSGGGVSGGRGGGPGR